MKKALLLPALPALFQTATAQQGFQTEAVIISQNGDSFRAWITAATATSIRYREAATSTVTTDAKLADYAGVFLIEPPEYSAAIDLFQGRKYAEAREKFAAIKTRFRPIVTLRDNFSTLAAFYEMECMRKMGDLEALAETLKDFNRTPLTRETQLRQIEIYVMWDAVRTESWDRLDLICRERAKEKFPAELRTQVAYCHGLALQNLNRPIEALNAYAVAMTADGGASEELAQQAALNSLKIHFQDPDVQIAIQNWGTEDENQNTGGFFRLTEAGALAVLYEISLGGGKPLPAELKELSKFKASGPQQL